MQNNTDLFKMVNDVAKKFDGKSQTELIKAVYEEAKKNKEKGILSDAEIENFKNILMPFLDDKKRKLLIKITNDLKKI